MTTTVTPRRPAAPSGRPPDARPVRSGTARWMAALALIAIGIAWIHGPSLRAPFFADDYLFLQQVRERSLGEALTSPDPLGNFFRPVGRQLAFWMLARAGGESPLPFHAFNLASFALLAALLFVLVRRWAGTKVAVFAAAFVGLHYAADVPVLWASGSQDLLAAVLAVVAIGLQAAGRRAWAVPAYALALLSKESVALVPLIAVVIDRERLRSWRPALFGALPLFAVTAVWAVAWMGTAKGRPGAMQSVGLDPASFGAALAHLAQVAAGLELGARPAGSWVAIAGAALLAAGAVFLTARGGSERGAAGLPRGSAVRIGAAWAILGALPVAVVAPIWSAYFYLFALCGAGIALGGLARLGPRWLPVAAIAMLAAGSAHARQITEFATARRAWTPLSHVNRFHLERAMATTARLIADLRRARPSVRSGTTIFFGNVPRAVGFQTADGPVVRWIYRDPTLRSHYVSEFSEDRLGRGDVLFFVVEGDTLRDRTGDPQMLSSVAYSLILGGKPAAAGKAIELALLRSNEPMLHYWRAWTQWAAGDTAAATASLRSAGTRPAVDPGAGRLTGERPRSRADSLRLIDRLLDGVAGAALTPGYHARLAALCLPRSERRQSGVIEAYAFLTLMPGEPDAWRKWAAAQLAENFPDAALRTLERYLAVGGETARRDVEALRVMAALRQQAGAARVAADQDSSGR